MWPFYGDNGRALVGHALLLLALSPLTYPALVESLRLANLEGAIRER